ncbi:MAG: Histidine kinase-, DNA gyrase B-, and [Parcubacteria group bacterium GW2011_GWA2_51_10]|nr:MAG: Histidine kinase-, DNA gyrase B-, and [Parcubacteria group bacterium GW2011_GWA2_51_10]
MAIFDSIFEVLLFQRLDLLLVGIAIAAIGLLGVVIYINKPHSASNKAFMMFALVTVLWSIVNYVNYKVTSPELVLWLLRALIFLGVYHAFTFFHLFYVYPLESKKYPRVYTRVLIPIVVATSLWTLTPFVFSGIDVIAKDGSVSKTIVAPGIVLFLAVILFLIGSGLYQLIRKMIAARGGRSPYVIIFVGTVITFSLLIAFNIILPAVFLNVRYIPFGALFILPFAACMALAIYRHDLFNLKVTATSTLVFALAIANLAIITLVDDVLILAFSLGAFVLVLAAGILLIRGVMREIEQRQIIEKQEKELEVSNQQQENLIHFISHEVKGYLATNAAVFSAIVEGDLGKVEPRLGDTAHSALSETRRGADLVKDILEAANLKKGTVHFDKKELDFAGAVSTAVEFLRSEAQEKGLALTYDAPSSGSFVIVGDEQKLRDHVIRNIIDNSIRYTPHGSVRVMLTRSAGWVRLTVVDTGVGITTEDMAKLFQPGSPGKDSIKVNVHSTGYGLFIAKSVIDAHGGKIWATSEGAGKGSRFVVELPVASTVSRPVV